jgi:hypothetical protein
VWRELKQVQRAELLGWVRGEDSLLEFSWIKNVMIDYSGRVNDPFVIRT